MRFNLDHDWHDTMSTPRARIGERAKTRLLIVLCGIWLCMGLVGHAPWKPFESQSISVIKHILETGNWLTPMAVSHASLESPPLYYAFAAALAWASSPVLPMHDAARITSGLWMLITLLMVGMAGRELWGKGYGRQTSFLFIGCLGLVVSAHTMMPAVASLTGLSIAFYAVALSRRRPYRAAALLGLGLGIGFLSTGLLPVTIIVACLVLLPILFAYWRNKHYLIVLSIAALISSPFLTLWPILAYMSAPDTLLAWWSSSLNAFQGRLHWYFLSTLLWYAWPVLPLALWGLWRYRHQLFTQPKFQLMLVFFASTFVLIGFGGERKEIFALPLLLPLTAMAGGSIETLKRGAAGALNWFGFILFGLLSVLIWLGWTAMIAGSPAKIKERLTYLSGLQQLHFSSLAFIIASAMTLIWLFAIMRSQHSNRSAATNWAIGMTSVWTMLMTLWLPMIESARSYEKAFIGLKAALPNQYACVNSLHLGSAQRDLLHYYADIKTYRFETEQQLNCDLYLIQDDRDKPIEGLGQEWTQIWASHKTDRRESFRLFQFTH